MQNRKWERKKSVKLSICHSLLTKKFCLMSDWFVKSKFMTVLENKKRYREERILKTSFEVEMKQNQNHKKAKIKETKTHSERKYGGFWTVVRKLKSQTCNRVGRRERCEKKGGGESSWIIGHRFIQWQANWMEEGAMLLDPNSPKASCQF